MTKNQLRQKLIDDKIPQQEYSLNGGLPNEAHCLLRHGDSWEVYYSERGIKTGLKIFDDEEQACDYFYTWLISSLRRMDY